MIKQLYLQVMKVMMMQMKEKYYINKKQNKSVN